jgi:Domain of unknown function (DUF4258)
MPSVIQKIRQKILREEYIFSFHAIDELENDGFTTADALSAILNGEIIDKLFYNDVRGTRYVIVGSALDLRVLEVVCRFHAENVLVITAYEIFIEKY